MRRLHGADRRQGRARLRDPDSGLRRARGDDARGHGLMANGGLDERAPQRGSLSVVRPSANGGETFIRISAAGEITAFNGHVDLGTGIRTALGQIVAEELDVSFARVVVVLGDTAVAPNQGATIASETIQITAVPVRDAAAPAPRGLLRRGAQHPGAAAAGTR